MSRCPFWSTPREKIECYKECPMLVNESYEGKDGSNCIFHDCTESNSVNFRDIVKDDYSFLSMSVYDEENSLNVNY